MKIVVIGGTGQIGSKVVARLTEQGHEAVAASPQTGVNTLTGDGLAEVLAGAQVVVDVTNAPCWEDQAVLDFFTTSTRNQLAAEAEAGVRHHVALSVVGSRDMPGSGYMRAKVAQEDLIAASGDPVHDRPRDAVLRVRGVDRGRVQGRGRQGARLAAAVPADRGRRRRRRGRARVAIGAPVGAIEIAGPDKLGIDEAVRLAVPGRRRRRRPGRGLLRRGRSTTRRSSPATTRGSASGASPTSSRADAEA